MVKVCEFVLKILQYKSIFALHSVLLSFEKIGKYLKLSKMFQLISCYSIPHFRSEACVLMLACEVLQIRVSQFTYMLPQVKTHNRGFRESLEKLSCSYKIRLRVLKKSIFRYIEAAFMACLHIVMRTPYYSAAAFLMLLLLLVFRCPFTTIHKSTTTKRSLPVTVVFYFYYGRATDLLFK